MSEQIVEVITKTYPDGSKQTAEDWLNGEKIAYRWWYEDGQLEFEAFLTHGIHNGPQRRWHMNGALMWESFYKDGYEHGTSRQWDPSGKLLGTYEMQQGTGVDLWWHDDGALMEERRCKDGKPHGIERNWGSDGQLWHERYWKEGQWHGIERGWNALGRLKRGFPKYFVNGEQVNKRKYLRACAADTTLVAYDDADNAPVRSGRV